MDRISSAAKKLLSDNGLPPKSVVLANDHECDGYYRGEMDTRNSPVIDVQDSVIYSPKIGKKPSTIARTIVKQYFRLRHKSESPYAFDGSAIDFNLSGPQYYFPLFKSVCNLLNVDSSGIQKLFETEFSKNVDDVQAIDSILHNPDFPSGVLFALQLMTGNVRVVLSNVLLGLGIVFLKDARIGRDPVGYRISYYSDRRRFYVIHEVREMWRIDYVPSCEYSYSAKLSVARLNLKPQHEFVSSDIDVKCFPESIVIPQRLEEQVVKELKKSEVKNNVVFGFKEIFSNQEDKETVVPTHSEDDPPKLEPPLVETTESIDPTHSEEVPPKLEPPLVDATEPVEDEDTSAEDYPDEIPEPTVTLYFAK